MTSDRPLGSLLVLAKATVGFSNTDRQAPMTRLSPPVATPLELTERSARQGVSVKTWHRRDLPVACNARRHPTHRRDVGPGHLLPFTRKIGRQPLIPCVEVTLVGIPTLRRTDPSLLQAMGCDVLEYEGPPTV